MIAARVAADVRGLGGMSGIQQEIGAEVSTGVRGASTGVDSQQSTNLDLLRAIAVLCVLFSHVAGDVFDRERLGPFGVEDLGRVGVIFFFVHTSLVLLMSLDRSSESFGQFYMRRAFRIYPLSILTIAIVLAAKIPYSPAGPYIWPGWTAVANNVILFTALPHHAFVIGPLWSLPYEVNMYVAIPLVYMAVRRRGPECAWVMFGCSVTAVFLAAVMRLSVVTDLLLFVPCFLSGAVAFVAPRRRLPGHYFPLLIVGVALVFAAASTSNALSWALNWAAAALIGLAIPAFSDVTSRPAAALSKHIARYSYGIYLSHAPIMRLCFTMSKWSAGVQWFAFIVMMICLPPLLYHFVEEPFIRTGKQLAQRFNYARDTGNSPRQFPCPSM